jgi:hypothetical protein
VGNYIRAASWQVEPEYRQATAQFIQEYMLPPAQARVNDGTSEGWGVTRPAAAMMSDDKAGFLSASSTFLRMRTVVEGARVDE